MLMDMDMDYGDDDAYYDEMDLVDSHGQPIKMMNNGQVMYGYANQFGDSSQGMGMIDSSSGGEALMANGFEILEEELDENYDPSAEEIEEYAKYLGMDLTHDRHLFYIAKEGLKAPLPGPWKPCKSPGSTIYYFNFNTKELQKEHPCDDYYRRYYLNEKSLAVKKKEERVIKKQIKEQQKQQEQYNIQMGKSVSSAGVTAGATTGGNAVINQMMMQDYAFGGSMSAVEELLSYKVEELIRQKDEERIIHERQKTE